MASSKRAYIDKIFLGKFSLNYNTSFKGTLSETFGNHKF